MGVLAFIPARGGSKSIPNKNIKDFCGKPLIYWNLKALEESEHVDKVVVATDSEEIKNIALSFGFSKIEIYNRSESSATDTSSTESVMLEYIENTDIASDTNFMLVQCTSPLTKSEDYSNAIESYQKEGKDSLLSCARQKRFLWNKGGGPINYDFNNRPRRQDFSGDLVENGAFYINTVKNIKASKCRLSGKVQVYEMPEYTILELDEEHDWLVGEALMKKYNFENNKKQKIKLFLSDVDGVLTDAGMYYTENGDELKKFSTYDGMGFSLLSKEGIKTGIVTSENTKLNERRANKIGLDYLFQGAKNKLSLITELCKGIEISLNEIAYIGDDINDFDLLSAVGLAACPANARKKIKSIPGILQLQTNGGDGAVREFVEIILNEHH